MNGAARRSRTARRPASRLQPAPVPRERPREPRFLGLGVLPAGVPCRREPLLLRAVLGSRTGLGAQPVPDEQRPPPPRGPDLPHVHVDRDGGLLGESRDGQRLLDVDTEGGLLYFVHRDAEVPNRWSVARLR